MFVSTKYPAGDSSDGQYLYRALGSFWTQIFQDKNVLKGYTLGMAEEFIQAYQRLSEVLQEFSVKNINVYRKDKWKPLIIKKSEFNEAPFVFESEGAVFGYQSKDDALYANQLFRFGYPKLSENKNLYSFKPSYPLKNFKAITNKVIAPSLLMLPGIDVVIKNDIIYFNSDLFSNEYIPRAKIVKELGETEKFIDGGGNLVDDEFIVLWIHFADTDHRDLYNNFGNLLDLKLESSEEYKRLLEALMNLFVEGPTISALRAAVAALFNTPLVLETREIVEQLYTDDLYNYLVTDKHVYRLRLTQQVKPTIHIGGILFAGDTITDEIAVVDSVISPRWWLEKINADKLGFASHIFAASSKYQLFFENKTKLLSYKEGTLFFPVQGREEDVKAFQAQINQPDNKQGILAGLNLSPHENQSISINPLDFVFTHIFKNNTLLVNLNFPEDFDVSDFFKLFRYFAPHFPAHVYIVVYANKKISEDILQGLNTGNKLKDFASENFCWDGSLSQSGARPRLLPEDPLYYKDYANRFFCVSVGPYRDGLPLHHANNLDTLEIDNSTTREAQPGIKAGLLRTHIPLSVVPPGESEENARIPSTREVPSILLIDF